MCEIVFFANTPERQVETHSKETNNLERQVETENKGKNTPKNVQGKPRPLKPWKLVACEPASCGLWRWLVTRLFMKKVVRI